MAYIKTHISTSRLRPAFKRTQTFPWFAVALAAMCTRCDLKGVSRLVRRLGLKAMCYDRLSDWFHPHLLKVHGRIIRLADGIQAPKRGRKTPE